MFDSDLPRILIHESSNHGEGREGEFRTLIRNTKPIFGRCFCFLIERRDGGKDHLHLHNVPEYGFVDVATTAKQAAMLKISIENSYGSLPLRYHRHRAAKVCYLVIDIGYINLHIIRPAK